MQKVGALQITATYVELRKNHELATFKREQEKHSYTPNLFSARENFLATPRVSASGVEYMQRIWWA
ncbi:MAG: hypothetical protein JSR44_16610 [Spirochaetes bacterium]|nr:hypothetical protein [Spirochaetota bacterium]